MRARAEPGLTATCDPPPPRTAQFGMSEPCKKRFVKRMARSFADCTKEAKAYGSCLSLHFEAVEKGACEKEFLALSKCFRGSLAKAPKN